MEWYEHSTDLLPTAWCLSYTTALPLICDRHFHYMLEILYLREGSMDVGIGEHHCSLSPGDAVFINSGIIHRTETVSYAAYYDCSIPGYLLNPTLCRVLPDCTLLSAVGEPFANLLSLLEKTVKNPNRQLSDPLSQIMISSLSNAILSAVAMGTDTHMCDRHDDVPLRSIITYLSTHYTDQTLSTETLSALFGYTPRMLSDIFNQSLHIGVKQYIDNLRINDAMHRLVTSTDSIESIADAVGYPSVRSFYRIFSRITGMTPNRYRNRT